MAVHKVPQDVEADDKFFGPLSFKQFLFGGGSLVLGYVIFVALSRGAWPFAIVILPFFAFFTALAFPWSKDQPTELWLASRIRFLLVPHKRIWNQSGMKDLVTITVPKREAHIYSDGLSQDQVRSRLNALATVVDTRGWAVKNVMATPQGAVVPMQQQTTPSDRLVEARSDASLTERVAVVESTQDIMDDQQNPVAQQFNSLLQQSTEKHKQDTLAMIQQARHNAEQQAAGAGPTLPPVSPQAAVQAQPAQQQDTSWLLTQKKQPTDPTLASFQQTATVLPGQTATDPATNIGVGIATVGKQDEEKLLEHVKEKKKRDKEILQRSHLKVIKTPEEIKQEEAEERAKAAEESIRQQMAEQEAAMAQYTPTPASTTPVDPAILNLASNDDLNVETLARQAQKDKLDDDTEVVISLR